MPNNKRSRLNASQDSERQQEAGPSQKRARSRPVWEVRRSPSADPERTANSQELSEPSSSDELPGSPPGVINRIATPVAATSSASTERACRWQVEFERHAAMFVSHLDKVDEAAMDDDTWQEHFSSVLATKATVDRAMDAYFQRLRSSSRTAATSNMTIGGRPRQESWRRPKEPIPLVKSPADAKPSYHTMAKGQRELPPTAHHSEIKDDIHGFISELEQQHPLLMATPVKLEKLKISWGLRKLRTLANEQKINAYFTAEVEPVIEAILNAKWPEARFDVVEGNSNGQADLFLRVSIKNADGKWVYSSVAVELKRPYGANHEESARASRKKWPRWMRDANMPNDKVAEHVLRQIVTYIKGTDTRAPKDVRGSIVPHVGLISNYNSTWIVSIRSVVDTALRSAPPTERLCVSSRFSLDSTETPIAFVYAYVLDGIIADMKASKSGYKEEKDLEDDSE